MKTGQPLSKLAMEDAGAVVAHPRQCAIVPILAGLVDELRACEVPGDYYEFQRELFGQLHAVEGRRGQCSRIVKRLKRGASLPEEHPVLPDGRDPNRLEDWQFEEYVEERLARQLRTIGDGLAWRLFGYDRRMIMALSRNQSPGPMHDKKGLPTELGFVKNAWEERNNFALLHDLTNCLRIADVTEFTEDRGALLSELKRKPRSSSAQIQRIEQAVSAVMRNGELPGDPAGIRFTYVNEPYCTELVRLQDLMDLANEHGVRGMRLLPGRALVGASLVTAWSKWDKPEEGEQVLESTRRRALVRAGIDKASHLIRVGSADTAARSPFMAPFSIYPLRAEVIAALISDFAFFEVFVSIEELEASLRRAGLGVSVLLPEDNSPLTGDQAVLSVSWRGRRMTGHAEFINMLLFELVDLDCWAKGTAEVLQLPNPPSGSVPIFQNEAAAWTAIGSKPAPQGRSGR